MKAELLAGQKNKHPGFPIPPLLLALDTFVLGGFAAFLVVDRLLNDQLAHYAPRHMDAASAILDLLDDLIPYLVVCGATSLVLVLSTICVVVWRRSRSRVLRYGTVLLALLMIAFALGAGFSGRGMTPPVPPMTPTPVP